MGGKGQDSKRTQGFPVNTPHWALLRVEQWTVVLTPTVTQLWVLTLTASEEKEKNIYLAFSGSGKAESLTVCAH